MRTVLRACAVAALAVLATVGWSMATAEEKPVAGEAIEIPTQRDLKLVAAIHRPEKPNGTAVVIAPGQGYHKDLPLIVESAKALADAGFLAVRFDWAYHTAGGQRSADLSKEMDDLEASLHFARNQDGVEKVIVAGKSLGSIVAFNRAAARPGDLTGLALLTFPIHDPGAPEALFLAPGAFDKATVPTLIVSGLDDPLCEPKALYGFLAQTENPPAVVITPGDHSLRPPSKDKDESAENVRLAVDALVLWARRWAK